MKKLLLWGFVALLLIVVVPVLLRQLWPEGSRRK